MLLSKRTNLIVAALLFIVTAAVTLWQNAHVAILWDLSYLLDSSYRIALGQIPYRDFPFAHAPLTFLIQAAIIHFTGRVYLHHILYAALAGAAATLLTWRILLNLIKDRLPHANLIATLLATPLIFLGIYSIYPHPIYDSDCALAVLAAIYLLQRATTPVRSALAGATLIPPLFFKQNIGLLFLATALIAILALAVTNLLHRQSIRSQLWIAAGAVATLALALLTIHLTTGLHNYLYWTFTFAMQRRLPGLAPMLGVYTGGSFIWRTNAILAALGSVLILHPSRSQVDRWRRIAAIILACAPFLWAIATFAFQDDPSDRADQLLSLWPHLLILSIALALLNLRRKPTFNSLLPIILLATIHGAFLSQQLWGSTYAMWPLLILLIACLLTTVPIIATPIAAVVAATFLLCGSLYSFSHERLSYTQLSGDLAHATLPQLRGMSTPGLWIPAFEELIRDTDRTIPGVDTILLLPGQDPFYFATGRIPRFPILLFDPATNPYSPQELVEQADRNPDRIEARWLIVNRTLQLTEYPLPNHAAYLEALQAHFVLDHSLTNYDIYRRR